MDLILEILVKKQKQPADTLKGIAYFVAAIAAAVLGFYYLKAFGIIVAAAAFYGAYRLFTGLNMEYEYCIVDGDITVDKVLNKSRRKSYVAVSKETIELIAPQGSDAEKSTKPNAKVCFAAETLTDSANYVIVGRNGQETVKLIVKMDERMKTHFRQRLPRQFQE